MEQQKIDASGSSGSARPYKQWIATLTVFLVMLQIGIKTGWTSPNLARLTGPNSPIPLTKEQASWVASLPGLGSLFGSILGAGCNAQFGSRKAILITVVVDSIAWIHVIAANSYVWLYASRIISGIGIGSTFCCFSLYLGEVASPNVRGTCIAVAALGTPIGAVVGSTMEVYLGMRTSSSIYLGICAVSFTMFVWLMDTPYYLVKKDAKLAKRSIVFYDSQCDADRQLQEISGFVKAGEQASLRDQLREFNSPTVIKSMILIMLLFAIPQLTGVMVINSYMEIIVTNSQSKLLVPKQFVIYAKMTGIVSSVLTFNLIDKLGRRLLLVGSTLGTSLAMTALGVHFMLLKQGTDPASIEWLPIASIVVYLVTFSIALNGVPSAVLSELFSDNTKSTAALVAPLSASLAGFVMSKIYQPLLDASGESTVFWLYAGLALVSIPTAICMPETKGKSFQEIQDDLQGVKRNAKAAA